MKKSHKAAQRAESGIKPARPLPKLNRKLNRKQKNEITRAAVLLVWSLSLCGSLVCSVVLCGAFAVSVGCFMGKDKKRLKTQNKGIIDDRQKEKPGSVPGVLFI